MKFIQEKIHYIELAKKTANFLPGGSTLLTANEEPWDPKGRFAASESHQSGRCSGLAGVGVGS